MDTSGSQAAQPQKPQQFPTLNISVARDGVVIQMFLGPGLVLQQGIGEEHMNQLCQEWLKSRQEIRGELQLIQNLHAEKTLH